MKVSLKWFAVVLTIVLLATVFYLLFEPPNTSARVIRVACVGDSITSDTKYTDDLSSLLGAKYTVGNFGVGRTTVSLDFNKPYMNQSAFQNALDFKPDIVVIMLGTNDAYLSSQQRSNFVGDYKTLIESFISLSSNPKVYIVIPPPVFNNTTGLPPEVVDDIVIPLVNQTAIDLGLPTIDVHTPLLNSPGDFQDGVHPNPAGSQVIASEVYDAIT
jgi:acyl-CoA thioesterase-1